MGTDLEKIGPVFRDARRRLHVTQAALAAWLGTTQSAVSMFESGRGHSLALPKIEKAAARLGVDLETGELLHQDVAPPTARSAKYCPSDRCPANVPFAIGEDLVLWPTFADGATLDGERCPACATALRDTCVNPGCGAAVIRGRTHCLSCGTPYVVVTHTCPGSVAAWADAQRERIAQLRRMIGMDEAGRW